MLKTDLEKSPNENTTITAPLYSEIVKDFACNAKVNTCHIRRRADSRKLDAADLSDFRQHSANDLCDAAQKMTPYQNQEHPTNSIVTPLNGLVEHDGKKYMKMRMWKMMRFRMILAEAASETTAQPSTGCTLMLPLVNE
jgi:hypothetical protein